MEDLDKEPRIFQGGHVYLVLARGFNPGSGAISVWGCSLADE